MRPRPLMWFVISLLCLAGAYYFWQMGERWAAQKKAAPAAPTPQSAQEKKSSTLSPVAAQESVVTSSTAPMALLTQPQPAAKTNESPLAYRLSNTTRPLRELVRDDHALLLENALLDTATRAPLDIPDHLRAQGDPGT